ncbi:MAG: transcriptional repressor [Bryobacteraceae bacterium]
MKSNLRNDCIHTPGEGTASVPTVSHRSLLCQRRPPAMMTPVQRLAWALNFCGKVHLRITPAREKILACMARHRVPINLDAISEADEIGGCCDATTVYRTLMLFKEIGVARQVSVHHKIRYFVLNVPGETCAYLICQCCGAVNELPPLKSGLELTRHAGTAKGYAAVYHELQVYGVCPQCQKTRWNNVRAAKLPIRA